MNNKMLLEELKLMLDLNIRNVSILQRWIEILEIAIGKEKLDEQIRQISGEKT